jgi:alanine racemase
MIDHGLEPEIYGLKGMEELYRILHFRGIRHYPVHIKIDTGMHRLGFQEQDLESAIPLMLRDEFRVASVFSHLAASDQPEHDDFSNQQIELFKRLSDRLSRELQWPFDRHLLNSVGMERFPMARFQMVRLGIGLHGIGKGKQLTPVSAYKTNISQLRMVKKGDSIGYSRSAMAKRNMQVATIPVGYADGMDRRLGNGIGRVYVGGRMAPTVGNICMDMTMIDVTGCHVSEGDEVEIFGKNLPVSELARLAGTIPYEVLTSIPERVKRVYMQE